jgi:hypothetical protein
MWGVRHAPALQSASIPAGLLNKKRGGGTPGLAETENRYMAV